MQVHTNVADSKENICIADVGKKNCTFPEDLSQKLARDRVSIRANAPLSTGCYLNCNITRIPFARELRLLADLNPFPCKHVYARGMEVVVGTFFRILREMLPSEPCDDTPEKRSEIYIGPEDQKIKVICLEGDTKLYV